MNKLVSLLLLTSLAGCAQAVPVGVVRVESGPPPIFVSSPAVVVQPNSPPVVINNPPPRPIIVNNPPPVVYTTPAPVYVAPQPVYVPPPVVVAPAPVFVAPPVFIPPVWVGPRPWYGCRWGRCY